MGYRMRKLNRPLIVMVSVIGFLFAGVDANAQVTSPPVLPPSPGDLLAASDLKAATECSETDLRKGIAKLSWLVAETPGNAQRVDVTTATDRIFRDGQYTSTDSLHPDRFSFDWTPTSPGVIHHWRVLTLQPDGWHPSETSDFTGPICVADFVQPEITLASFKATAGDGEVLLQWTTTLEVKNQGFNILRGDASSGSYVKANETLIPTKPLASSDANYEFMDKPLENGKTHFYKLENVFTDGSTRQSDPLEIAVIKGQQSTLSTGSQTQNGGGCAMIMPPRNGNRPSAGPPEMSLPIFLSVLAFNIAIRWMKRRRPPHTPHSGTRPARCSDSAGWKSAPRSLRAAAPETVRA